MTQQVFPAVECMTREVCRCLNSQRCRFRSRASGMQQYMLHHKYLCWARAILLLSSRALVARGSALRLFNSVLGSDNSSTRHSGSRLCTPTYIGNSCCRCCYSWHLHLYLLLLRVMLVVLLPLLACSPFSIVTPLEL